MLKTQKDKDIRKRTESTIRELDRQIKTVEKDFSSRIQESPELKKNYELLISIKSIGLINATATIIATANFTKFNTARQYAKFCKVSLLEFQSGTSVKDGIHVPTMGHTELKSLLTAAAKSAIVHDAQLKTYYDRKRVQGKTHGCVMNAIKFKLIERMFCVIKRGSPYVDTESYRSR